MRDVQFTYVINLSCTHRICCEYVPPPKRRKTSETRIALATHRDMVNELLSAGLSNHQNELESEPRTKDVGIQCGKYFAVCVHAVVNS